MPTGLLAACSLHYSYAACKGKLRLAARTLYRGEQKRWRRRRLASRTIAHAVVDRVRLASICRWQRRNGNSRRAVLLRRLDVLIHAEEVIRVVRRLDPGKAIIVLTVRGMHQILPLVHHHVDVAASV